MRRLILASASPRRKSILEMLDLDFSVCPADADESVGDIAPDAAVCAIAKRKAVAAYEKYDLCNEDVVIAADTVVSLDGKIIGKPESPKHAEEILRSLSGRTHNVYSSIVLMHRGKIASRAVATEVEFRELSDMEITRYVNSGEPMDKAGAYGYQGPAGVFVKRIDGDFYNVIGLPLCELELMLQQEFGLSLYMFEKKLHSNDQ